MTMDQLADLKVQVRKLKKYLHLIRLGLDSGDNDIYDNLDKAEMTTSSFNRSLREIGKTLDKRQKV